MKIIYIYIYLTCVIFSDTFVLILHGNLLKIIYNYTLIKSESKYIYNVTQYLFQINDSNSFKHFSSNNPKNKKKIHI